MRVPGHVKQRRPAKNMNFGIAYGLMSKGLSESLGITQDEAQKLITAYCAANPDVIAMLEKNGKQAKMTSTVRTITGRIRNFIKPTWEVARKREDEFQMKEKGRPANSVEVNKRYAMMFSSIEREGKNAPIHGSNADLAKLVMGCGFDKNAKPFMYHILPQYGAELINFVHDEFVIEVPEQNAQACYEAVMDCMVRAGEEIIHRVRMSADGHIADWWVK